MSNILFKGGKVMKEKTKITLKGFVLGIVVTTMLMSTAVGAQVRKTIDVIYNSVNVTVNGEKVDADNLLYKGTTYVPLRAISEMLGKEVGWDKKTNTASINDKGAKGGLITVDQVPYKIDILEPDSIGTVYMNATYTNKTEYPITSIDMKVLCKDTNKIGYLTNHDTVMPGEKSPIFDGFGPATMKHEDYEILTITIRAEKPNGKTLKMEYDTKLKKYEYNEYDY